MINWQENKYDLSLEKGKYLAWNEDIGYHIVWVQHGAVIEIEDWKHANLRTRLSFTHFLGPLRGKVDLI